jgi:hypothetical protein
LATASSRVTSPCVDNVVDANLLAMGADGDGGRLYSVGCGQAVTLDRLFAELDELIDRGIEPVYATPRVGDIRPSLADLTMASRDFAASRRSGCGRGCVGQSSTSPSALPPTARSGHLT